MTTKPKDYRKIRFTNAEVRLIYAALVDAIEDRSSFADSLTNPNGKPLPDYKREFRRAERQVKQYEKLREKINAHK